MILRIAIVEDETECREEIVADLKRYETERRQKVEITTFTDGMDFIEEYSAGFDVVLMDINMPNMNGLDAARRLRRMDENVCLIFITNMAKYAIKGYEVSAMDFMVKPIMYLKLARKLDKVLSLVSKNEIQVSIRTEHGIKVVGANDISYVEVNHNYLTYHLCGGG